MIVEPNYTKAVYDSAGAVDYLDQSFRPDEEVMYNEENSLLNEPSIDESKVGVDVLSKFFSMLFAMGAYKNPSKVAYKLYLVCLSVRPDLMDGISLKELGNLFGKDKRTVSSQLIQADEALGLRCRNRKSESARQHYREVQRAKVQAVKSEERRQRKNEYNRQYRILKGEELNAKRREQRKSLKEKRK